MKPYAKLLAMTAVSTVVMFGLMYLNTFRAEHVFFSETRSYMALVMGATMAVLMFAFMHSMYPNRSANAALVAGAVALFAGSLWLVRSQTIVDDVSYMRAMIPHHSIAILTSERAHLTDLRVRELAARISATQKLEIEEMKALIAKLDQR